MTDNYTDLARCMGCEPHEVSDLIQQHAPWNGREMCEDAMRERLAAARLFRTLGLSLMAEAVERGKHLHLVDEVERGEHRREEEG